ncbi:MAG: urease accessory protein UreD [Pseudomonadota bacterium]
MTELPTSMAPLQPRARGEVCATFDVVGGTTRLVTLRQAGSSRALFPRTPSRTLQMVLTNTSGGVTGGDRFRTDIRVAAGAAVTVTTQAAERAYRAQPGQTGRVDTRLFVGRRSRLSWLPQETLLFDGCDFGRRLSVDLACDSTALVVEPLVFGRAAMGEILAGGGLDDRIELRCDGKPLYLDRVRLSGNLERALQRPAVADGSGASALVLYFAGDAEVRLPQMRALVSPLGGASQLTERLLVARLIAPDSFELRQCLVPLIELLHDDTIPRPWVI